jgi:Cytochrome P460
VNGLRVVGGNGITRIIFPGAPIYPKADPERHSFGVVYANDIAFESMNSKPRSNFKAGAIIVREKLAKPDSATPEMLAVMIKRPPGFNPRANDWEFLVLNGAATKVRNRQKKGECFDCHKTQQDFVYGDYERR